MSPTAAPRGPGLTGQEVAELASRVAQLDTLDYYEVLKITKEASPADIKKAFYRESRRFHPDRFFQLEDVTLKERVHDLYKRVTEAYYVLRDDRRRSKYAADMAGPERAKKLRFDEASEAESKVAAKKEAEEQIGTTPKGRQFFQSGMADFDAGRWSGAERNFKMALTFEPQNSRYKAKFEEAKAKMDAQAKQAGIDFRIK
jgi:DnaJ-class molecular chaperone